MQGPGQGVCQARAGHRGPVAIDHEAWVAGGERRAFLPLCCSAVSGELCRALAPQGVRGQRPVRRGQPARRRAATPGGMRQPCARDGLTARTPPEPPRFTPPGSGMIYALAT